MRRTPDGQPGWREYQYEADTIAQQVRSNSSVKTIEKNKRKTLDLEQTNDDEVKTVAGIIQAMVKK